MFLSRATSEVKYMDLLNYFGVFSNQFHSLAINLNRSHCIILKILSAFEKDTPNTTLGRSFVKGNLI